MTTTKACVLVADAARARCLWLEEEDSPGNESITLREDSEVWVSPVARVPEHERYQDSHTQGGRVAGSPGQTTRFDDHRQQHDEDERRRFAEEIAASVARLSSRRPVPRFVVCATHTMTSHLKHAWHRKELAAVPSEWLTTELTGRSPHGLHEHLAGRELLPPPSSPRVQR